MGRIFAAFSMILFLGFSVLAQGNDQWGLLPSININKKLPKDWSVNLKAESRQILYRDAFRYTYSLTDVSLIAATRIRLRTTVGAGYLASIAEDGIRHRTIQQISITRSYTAFRLSHRFSMDQTFGSQEEPEFRLRYRLSSEIPLQGQSLDPKEFFLKASNEYLNALQAKEYDLEIRTAAFIGYALTPVSKLEAGLDYRVDSFIAGNTRNRFWIGINFYHTIQKL